MLLWWCLLLHALHCSIAQCSWSIPLSESPSSDESGKQFLYPDGDPDHHQNLIISSLVHCRPSLKISCKSDRKFLHKIADGQTKEQTDKQQRLHILLGGGNNNLCSLAAAVRCPRCGWTLRSQVISVRISGSTEERRSVRLGAQPRPSSLTALAELCSVTHLSHQKCGYVRHRVVKPT